MNIFTYRQLPPILQAAYPNHYVTESQNSHVYNQVLTFNLLPTS